MPSNDLHADLVAALAPPLDLTRVKALLDQGAPLGLPHATYPTVAFRLTCPTQAEAVPLLNAAGLDWSVVNESGWTALDCALGKPPADLSEWLPCVLLRAGASNPNTPSGGLLHTAALNGAQPVHLDALLAAGVPPPLPHAYPMLLLFMGLGQSRHQASEQEQTVRQLIHWALDRGFDPTVLSEDGQSVQDMMGQDDKPWKAVMRAELDAHRLNRSLPGAPALQGPRGPRL